MKIKWLLKNLQTKEKKPEPESHQNTKQKTIKKVKEMLLVRPFTEAKGHTGFLTFAKK